MIKHKFDVFLESATTGDDESLVLLRFPAMRSQFENPADQIQLSIRPKTFKMKLDVSIDTDAPSFCEERAHSLASKSNPKIFTGIVDKNIYTSTKATIDDGQLYACKVVDEKLVCRPVSQLLTLRSDLSHLDIKEEVQNDIKEEVRPVSVKFTAPERPNLPTRNRDNPQLAEDPLDEYKPLSYANLASRDSAQQRALLFGKRIGTLRVKPDPDSGPEDRKPIPESYPDIKPKIEKMDVDEPGSADNLGVASSPRKSVVIKQRVRDCLLKAKLVSFDEVHEYLKGMDGVSNSIKFTNKDVIDALTELANLVQGNWAVKSEVLYGDSSERDCTDVTGISINLFIAARDYLLWLFNQDRIISRLEFSKKVRLPDSDTLELFNQLSIFKEDIRKWEFMLKTDKRFLEKFPEIVQRQATFWKVRRANKFSMFG